MYLGNLIRLQLLRDNSVRFAGYKVPHPLVNDSIVRVETIDSKVTPLKVFMNLFLFCINIFLKIKLLI